MLPPKSDLTKSGVQILRAARHLSRGGYLTFLSSGYAPAFMGNDDHSVEAAAMHGGQIRGKNTLWTNRAVIVANRIFSIVLGAFDLHDRGVRLEPISRKMWFLGDAQETDLSCLRDIVKSIKQAADLTLKPMKASA